MIRRSNSLVVRALRPDYSPRSISVNRWIISSSAVVGGSWILMHTLLKDVTKYFVELQRNGERVPVSDDVSSLAVRAMKDLNYPKEERKLVQLVVGSQMVTSSIGSSDTIFGTHLVVPDYVNSSNPRVADLVKFLQEQEASQEDIRSFQNTFILSENAKLYCIARQLVKSRTCLHYLLDSVSAFLIASGTGFVFVYLSDKFFPSQSVLIKLFPFSVLIAIGVLVFKSVSFLISVNFDEKAEQHMCNLGETYVTGGIEFCEKALQRFALFDKNTSLDISSYIENVSPLAFMSYADRLSLLKQVKEK